MFLYWMEMPGNEQRLFIMAAKCTLEEALNVSKAVMKRSNDPSSQMQKNVRTYSDSKRFNWR